MFDIYWASSKDNPEDHDALCKWASDNIWDDGALLNRVDTSMGVIDNGILIAVMVYHNYDPKAGVIEYSGAATDSKWLSSKVLYEMFSYPFEQLGCQMVVTRNSEKHTKLHRQLTAYGHEEHRVERLYGPDEAAIIWTLTKEDWLNNKFMKRAKNG